MTVWDFEVVVSTHDLLRRGVVEAEWLRVEVAAPSSFEASLVAIQMASAYGYPTDCVGPL